MSTVRLNMQKHGGRRKGEVGCGLWRWACFSGSFSASTAYPKKRGFSLNEPQNVFFCGWCDALGVSFPRRLNLPILPTKSFSMGQLRLHVSLELIGNPIMVNDRLP